MTSDRMTFHCTVCSPVLSPLCEFVAPVRSRCRVKQAVNQPDPYTATFFRHQQVSTVHVCHSVLVPLRSHAMLHLPSTRLLGFYKAVTVRALTFTNLKPPWTPNLFVAAGHCTANCMHVSGNGRLMLWQHSWFSTSLSCTLSKATDTPEDRNNPVLLYNKMELGDLNANFTLEVESQVKIHSLSVRMCCLCLARSCFLFFPFLLLVSVFSWRYLTGVTSPLR